MISYNISANYHNNARPDSWQDAHFYSVFLLVVVFGFKNHKLAQYVICDDDKD